MAMFPRYEYTYLSRRKEEEKFYVLNWIDIFRNNRWNNFFIRVQLGWDIWVQVCYEYFMGSTWKKSVELRKLRKMPTQAIWKTHTDNFFSLPNNISSKYLVNEMNTAPPPCHNFKASCVLFAGGKVRNSSSNSWKKSTLYTLVSSFSICSKGFLLTVKIKKSFYFLATFSFWLDLTQRTHWLVIRVFKRGIWDHEKVDDT